MLNKILMGGVGVLLLALWWVYSDLQDTRQKLGTAECQRDVAADVNEGNEAVRQAQESADTKRVGELERQLAALQAAQHNAAARADRLAREKAALQTQMEALYEADDNAKAWADTVVPNAVRERLRRNPRIDAHGAGGGD